MAKINLRDSATESIQPIFGDGETVRVKPTSVLSNLNNFEITCSKKTWYLASHFRLRMSIKVI